MKKYIIALVALTAAASVLAQGTMTFNNRMVGTVQAKIYGVETPNNTVAKTGNEAAGQPTGTQTYTGAALAGTAWYAQLWAAPGAGAAESSLTAVPGSLTTFRTGAAAGYITPPPADVAIPGAAAGTVATLQVRAWDASAGNTWAAAEAAWATKAAGKSALFNSVSLAGAPPAPSAALMDNFRSFNVYMNVIPEPSTFALLGLGALGMMIFRRK
jgi:hypothetical protein